MFSLASKKAFVLGIANARPIDRGCAKAAVEPAFHSAYTAPRRMAVDGLVSTVYSTHRATGLPEVKHAAGHAKAGGACMFSLLAKARGSVSGGRLEWPNRMLHARSFRDYAMGNGHAQDSLFIAEVRPSPSGERAHHDA